MTTEDQKFTVKAYPQSSLSIILVASIIASSAILIYIIVTPKPSEKFTEFYLLDSNGKASNYPTELKILEEGKVMIVIVNHEHEPINYRLEVIFNGSMIHEENIFLIENKKWEYLFIFKASKKGINQKLDFILYSDQQMEAYRILHLLVSII